MRIAYHPNGATLSAYALRQWIAAAKADITAAPGALIVVNDPRHPYSFGSEILSDDRETQSGTRHSRILTVRRRAMLEFNLCRPEIDALWQAWHLATCGGRIPFVWEEPLTGEIIPVSATVGIVSHRATYRRYQPATLELIEWL